MKKKYLYAYLFIAVLLLFTSACSGSKLKDGVSIPVQDFTYTNQDNKSVSLGDLNGQVWMADFIFTTCPDVCPPMTANMKKLQNRIKEEGLQDQVSFVSFSVDPDVDTPEKLKEFGDKYGIDYSNWNFLTGYSMDEIIKFADKSFESYVSKPENSDFVMHQSRFYLVDQTGTVAKTYNGINLPTDQIISDMKILLEQP